MTDHSRTLETALVAAVTAGNILREYAQDNLKLSQYQKESLRDVATPVDRHAQQEIIRCLSERSDAPVVAEEGAQDNSIDIAHGTYWLVDPLDGTVNYINRIALCAVSISYVEKGVPSVGVIYNPLLNELYYGADGLGVYRNHSTIALSPRAPETCLYAMTFSGAKHASRDQEYRLFQDINDSSSGCLRTGSAAMNLAYVADGRFGGCVGRNTRLWDIGAGLVLARLAGARVECTLVDPAQRLAHYTVEQPSADPFLPPLMAKYF